MLCGDTLRDYADSDNQHELEALLMEVGELSGTDGQKQKANQQTGHLSKHKATPPLEW